MHCWPLPVARWTWPPPVTVFPAPWVQPFLQDNPCRAPGTGILPGTIRPNPCCPPRVLWPTHDQYLEAWRAWQRCVGWSDPVQRPQAGIRPPNLFIPICR